MLATNAASTNDFAAANFGQLKWFATNALSEFEASLLNAGGAGDPLRTRVSALYAATGTDFRAINLGVLKNTAAPFYDRLGDSYPWSGISVNDYAAANIGQLKRAFDFNPQNIASQQFSLSLSASGAAAMFNRPAVSWHSGYSQVPISATPSGFYDYFIDWKDLDSGTTTPAHPTYATMNTNRSFVAEFCSLTNGLFLYYSFKNAVNYGSLIYSETGGSNYSSLNFAGWSSSGKLGGAAFIDYQPTNNGVIELKGTIEPGWDCLDAFTNKTICVWMKWFGQTNPACLYGAEVWLGRHGVCVSDTRCLTIVPSMVWHDTDAANRKITENRWYFVTVTYNGSTATLFLNSHSVTNTPCRTYRMYDMEIGSAWNGHLKWNGLLDEFMVFNRVLSSNEIVQLYNLTAPDMLNIASFNNPAPSDQPAGSLIMISQGATTNRCLYATNNIPVYIASNSTVKLSVTNDYVLAGGTERDICLGYTGTGQLAAGGTTNAITIPSLTQSSTVSWLWQTNYWASLVANGGCGHLSVNSGWFPTGSTIANLTAIPDGAGNFVQWSAGVETARRLINPISVPVNSPTNVAAQFSSTQGWLVVNSLYGSPNPGRGTNIVNYGLNTAGVTTDTRGTTQYVCLGWTGSGSVPATGSSTTATFNVSASPSSIAWQWATNYLLNTSVTPSSDYGYVSNNLGWYRLGATATVAAVQTSNSLFRNWSGSGISLVGVSNNNPLTFVVTNPVSLSANWASNYLVSFSVAPSSNYGSVTGSPSGWYPIGATAIVTAVQTTNSLFTRWTGSGLSLVGISNNYTLSFIVTNSVSLTANFDTYGSLIVRSDYGKASDLIPPKGTNFINYGTVISASASTNIFDGIQHQYSILGTALWGTDPWGQAIITGLVFNLRTNDIPNIQYVPTGWTGTGSVPATGNSNTTTFTFSKPSSINWSNWETKYLVTVDTYFWQYVWGGSDVNRLNKDIGPGKISNNRGDVSSYAGLWYSSGSNVKLEAVPTSGFVCVEWLVRTYVDPNIPEPTEFVYFGPNAPDFNVSCPTEVIAIFAYDSDNDGIPDLWENSHGLDPYDPSDANESLNFNGTNNLTAYRLYGDSYQVIPTPTNTPPSSLDSDGDGIADYYEWLFFGTGKLGRDSDGDGLSDGDEIFIYGTNPNYAFTCTNGIPDGWAVAMGLNPLNAANSTTLCTFGTFFDGANLVTGASNGWNNLQQYLSSMDTDGDGLVDYPSVATHVVPIAAYHSIWLPTNCNFAFANPKLSGFCQNEAALTNTFRVDSNNDGFSDAMEIFAGTNAVSSNSIALFTNNFAVLAVSIASPTVGKWGVHMWTPSNHVFVAASGATNGSGYACVPRAAQPEEIFFSLAYTNAAQTGMPYAVDFRLAPGGGPFGWVIDPARSDPVATNYTTSTSSLVQWGFVRPKFEMSPSNSVLLRLNDTNLPVCITLQPANAPYGSLLLDVATNNGGGGITIFTNSTALNPLTLPYVWSNNFPANIWIKGTTISASNDDVVVVATYSNALLSSQLTNRLAITVADISITWAHKYAIANYGWGDASNYEAQVGIQVAPTNLTNLAASVILTKGSVPSLAAYTLTGGSNVVTLPHMDAGVYQIGLSWCGGNLVYSNHPLMYVRADFSLFPTVSVTHKVFKTTITNWDYTCSRTPTTNDVYHFDWLALPVKRESAMRVYDEYDADGVTWEQSMKMFFGSDDSRGRYYSKDRFVSTADYTNSTFYFYHDDAFGKLFTVESNCWQATSSNITIAVTLSPREAITNSTFSLNIPNGTIISNLFSPDNPQKWTWQATADQLLNMVSNHNYCIVNWTLPFDPVGRQVTVSNVHDCVVQAVTSISDVKSELNADLHKSIISNFVWSVATTGSFVGGSYTSRLTSFNWQNGTTPCETVAVAVSYFDNNVSATNKRYVSVLNHALTLTPRQSIVPTNAPNQFLAFPNPPLPGTSMINRICNPYKPITVTTTGCVFEVTNASAGRYTIQVTNSINNWLATNAFGTAVVYVCNVSIAVTNTPHTNNVFPGAVVLRRASTGDCSRLVPLTLSLTPAPIPLGKVTLTLAGATTNYLVWTNSAKLGAPFNTTTNWPATNFPSALTLYIDGVTTSAAPRDLAWTLAYWTNYPSGAPMVTDLLYTTVMDASFDAYGPDKTTLLTNALKTAPGIVLSRNSIDADYDGKRDDLDVRFNGPADSNAMALVVFHQIPGITNFVGISNVFVSVSGPIRLFRPNATNNEACLVSNCNDPGIPSSLNIASQISTGDVRMLVEGAAAGSATISLLLGSVASDSATVTILPIPSDSDEDGLCQHSGGSLKNPEITSVDPVSFFPWSSVELGRGSLPCGLSVAAALTTWHLPSVTNDATFLRQNFCNLDTRVLPPAGDGFLRVLRPNGRIVAFDATNGLPQMPDLGRTYRLVIAGGNYVLVFASGYKHYFDLSSGLLVKVEDPNGTPFLANNTQYWPSITSRTNGTYVAGVSSPNYGTNGALTCAITYNVSNRISSVASDYTTVTFTNQNNIWSIKTTAGTDSHITTLTPGANSFDINRSGLLVERWSWVQNGYWDWWTWKWIPTDVVVTREIGTATTDYTLATDLLGDRVSQVTPIGRCYGEDAALYTTFVTQTDPALPGFGQVQWIIAPDSGYTYLSYNAFNCVTSAIRSIGGACTNRNSTAFTPPPAATCSQTIYDYTPLNGDQNLVDFNRPRTISCYYQGTLVGKEFRVYAANTRETRVATNVAASFTDPGNLITLVTFDPAFSGFLKSVVDPCGNTTAFTNTADGAGVKVASSITGDPVGEGTITWRDSHGWVLRADRASGGASVGMLSSNAFDSLGHLLTTVYPDNRSDLFRYSPWGACILSSNREGVVSTFIQDALLRTTNAVCNGVTTRYAALDSFGNARTISTFGVGTETQTVTRVFDGAGRLLSETAPFTGTTTYDTIVDKTDGPGSASGNLLVTTRGDHSITNESYRDGTLAGTYGSATHPVSYEYGLTNGQLFTRVYQFPALATAPALVPITTPTTNITTSILDFAGRLRTNVFGNGASIQYAYDNIGREICRKDENQKKTLTTYDPAGRMSRLSIDTTGIYLRKEYAFTNYGTAKVFQTDTYVSDTPTHEIRISRVWERVDGLGVWSFDAANKMTYAATVYNGNTRTTSVALPDGKSANATYANGMLTSYKPADCDFTTTIAQRDGFQRVKTIADAKGATTIEHALQSAPADYTKITQPTGSYTKQTSDQYGQIVAVEKRDGATNTVASYAWKTTGEPYQMSGSVNPLNAILTGDGIMNGYATYRNFNALPTTPATFSSLTPGGSSSVASWSITNNAASIPSDGGFNGIADVTLWDLDPARRWPVAKNFSDGTRVKMIRDPAGNLSQFVNARNMTNTFARDAADHVMGKTYSDVNTPNVAYKYNLRGLVTNVIDAAGNRFLAWDDCGRLTVETAPNATLAITYCTNSDERASATWAMGVTNALGLSYAFNTAGRLAAITAQCPALGATNLVFKYAWYTNDNRIAAIVAPNGVTNQYCYQTNADLVSAIRIWGKTPSLAPMLEYAYLYDDANRCTNFARPYENRRDLYAYDQAGHLVQAQRQVTGTWSTASWLFDTAGNRVAESNAITGIVTNRLHNGLNQIWTCAYDADGNLTGHAPWTYTWDAENRLKTVKSNGTLIATYQYDSQNRRISKTVGTATYRYIYDGWNLVAEVRSQGSAVSTNIYVWGADHTGSLDTDSGGVRALLAIISGASVYYPVMNNHGDVMALFDATGTNIVARYERDPFGVLLSSSGPAAGVCPFGFQSKYCDQETGLVYFGHRYYSPTLGIFISRDPLQEEGGVNLYGYGKGCPLAIDPTGLTSMWRIWQSDFALWEAGSYFGEATWAGTLDAIQWNDRNVLTNRLPLLGWATGPLGDILRGSAKISAGDIRLGLRDIAYGGYEFVDYIGEDAAALVWGMGVGKAYTFCTQGSTVVSGLSKWNSDELKMGIRGELLWPTIPGYGTHGGPNWGVEQEADPFMLPDKARTDILGVSIWPMGPHDKVTWASRRHDWNLDYMRNPESYKGKAGEAHSQWIKDSWSGPWREPGPFGQVYRLIGTPAFMLFSYLE